MKNLILIFFISILSIQLNSQNFKIFEGDTINFVDKNNQKQGLWIYFNNNYKNKIAQKGYYVDNKKNGKWTTFYPNGNVKSIITFKNNRQNGEVKSFYPNGNIQEEGFWKINKWIGEYKYYYDNGNIKYHWYFDENGKRTGVQTYFYKNGKKQIEGKWAEGKESGKITEYYATGKIQKVTNFANGQVDGSMIEYYPDGQLKSKIVYSNGQVDLNQSYAYQHKNNVNNNNNQKPSNTDSTTTTNNEYKAFSGTGYYKFVNDKGLVDREGTFKNGILVDGKRYIYDANGKKIKTAIIKNGKVIKVIKETENNKNNQ